MAKLSIKTNIKSVVVVGEFCDWDLDKALRVELKGRSKLLTVEDFPEGEYKVLSCKNYREGSEVFPSDARPKVENRYFNGKDDEKIYCYF